MSCLLYDSPSVQLIFQLIPFITVRNVWERVLYWRRVDIIRITGQHFMMTDLIGCGKAIFSSWVSVVYIDHLLKYPTPPNTIQGRWERISGGLEATQESYMKELYDSNGTTICITWCINLLFSLRWIKLRNDWCFVPNFSVESPTLSNISSIFVSRCRL